MKEEDEEPTPGEQMGPSYQDSPAQETGDQQGEIPQALGKAGQNNFSKISRRSALKILNALQEAEKDLLYMRRPPQKDSRLEVAKDW